ncbi:MAG: hypothetical protein V4486_03235 [Patescibacteria group bacterium]
MSLESSEQKGRNPVKNSEIVRIDTRLAELNLELLSGGNVATIKQELDKLRRKRADIQDLEKMAS